jgi:hypothetical protein
MPAKGVRDGEEIAFGLEVEFDSGDPEFVRGVEVGYLEAKIELLGEVAIREVVRRSNEEMVRRLSAAAGRHVTTEVLDDQWMGITIDPITSNGSAPSRPSR